MARSQESRGRREPTLTEQARRAQLIEVTIDRIAEHGYGGTSLSRIAEGAGITKAAVLYHFPTKAAVVRAAHEHVLAALTEHVGTAISAVGPQQAPAAYIRAMIGHLRERPRHTRVIIEAMTHEEGDHEPHERWGPLADLLAAAREDPSPAPEQELRTTAIIIGGAIDAIVAEQLSDPDYDTAAAADQLVAMVRTDPVLTHHGKNPPLPDTATDEGRAP